MRGGSAVFPSIGTKSSKRYHFLALRRPLLVRLPAQRDGSTRRDCGSLHRSHLCSQIPSISKRLGHSCAPEARLGRRPRCSTEPEAKTRKIRALTAVQDL